MSAAVPPPEESRPKPTSFPSLIIDKLPSANNPALRGRSLPLVQRKPATAICRRNISYSLPYFMVRSTISHAVRRISFLSYARVSVEAAVNGNRCTGDEGRIRLVAKEQKRSLEFFRLSETVHRRCGKNLARSCGRCAVLVP